MKKLFFSIALAGIFIISSCSKEEIRPSTSVANGKAIYSGQVLCNKNVTNDTNEFGRQEIQYEFIDSGKIIFHIDGKDLQPDPIAGYTYQNITVEADINSDGTFAVELPCRKKGTAVTVMYTDVIGTYTYLDRDRDNELVKKTSEEIFGRSATTLSIAPGDNQKLNPIYQLR